MTAREDALGMASVQRPEGLIYPIVFSDGDLFPPRARNTQYRRDFSNWRYPYEQFKEAAAYLEFHNAVTNVAAELAGHLNRVPEWQDNWPVSMPEVEQPAPPVFPRLV